MKLEFITGHDKENWTHLIFADKKDNVKVIELTIEEFLDASEMIKLHTKSLKKYLQKKSKLGKKKSVKLALERLMGVPESLFKGV